MVEERTINLFYIRCNYIQQIYLSLVYQPRLIMNVDTLSNLILLDFINGGETAMDQIYRHYAPKAYKVAYFLLQDNGWSDDVVQEVFIKIWQNRAKLQTELNLWAYIYVLTKRMSLNKLRSIKRSTACFEKLLKHVSVESNDVEDHILVKELSEQIMQFVAQLPPQQQKVFTLSRIVGISHQEIADELGISTNTVRNHIVQVLKNFRKQQSCDHLLLLIIFPLGSLL